MINIDDNNKEEVLAKKDVDTTQINVEKSDASSLTNKDKKEDANLKVDTSLSSNKNKKQSKKTLWFNDKKATQQIKCVVNSMILRKSACSYGSAARKLNSRMRPFVYTKFTVKKRSFHIIDIEQTTRYLNLLFRFVNQQAELGKKFLFVGTKPQAAYYIKKNAERCGAFYMSNRWISGLFTNFSVIKTTIATYNSLVREEALNSFKNLTKKEALKKTREMQKLRNNFEGILKMFTLPDFVFILDPDANATAVKEAKAKGIPIISVLNTCNDPRSADFFVPANNESYVSIRMIVTLLADAICLAKGEPVLIANKEDLMEFPAEDDHYHQEVLIKKQQYLENKNKYKTQDNKND